MTGDGCEVCRGPKAGSHICDECRRKAADAELDRLRSGLRTYYLYRFYDVQDRLLYVGNTWDVAGRFGSHAATKVWWPEVVTVRIERYPTRAEVFRAESRAIKQESPMFNIDQIVPRDKSRRAVCRVCGAADHRVTVRDEMWSHKSKGWYCQGSGMPVSP